MFNVDDEVWDNWENYDFVWENSFSEKTVVFYEHVQSNYMVNELAFGLEDPCDRDRTRQTTCKHDNETAALA